MSWLDSSRSTRATFALSAWLRASRYRSTQPQWLRWVCTGPKVLRPPTMCVLDAVASSAWSKPRKRRRVPPGLRPASHASATAKAPNPRCASRPKMLANPRTACGERPPWRKQARNTSHTTRGGRLDHRFWRLYPRDRTTPCNSGTCG